MPWGLLAALPWLVAIGLADVRWRIVPDGCVLGLSISAAFAAFALGVLPAHMLVGLVALALGVAAAILRLWGWGDAKLVGAAGFAAGSDHIGSFLLFTATSGFLLAAVILAMRPLALARLRRAPPSWPRWAEVELTRLRRAPSVPYALAIAAGLAAALVSPAA